MRIRCNILKTRYGGDNYGISKIHDTVILTDEETPPDDINGIPVVKLIRREIQGEYVHVEPVKRIPLGSVGYMMGGCFIVANQSMGFPSRYPIPLHDRIETLELYNSMD